MPLARLKVAEPKVFVAYEQGSPQSIMPNRTQDTAEEALHRKASEQRLKEHLSFVDAGKLIDKIRAFRTLPIKTMSKRQIADEISKVLCFETPRGLSAMLTPSMVSYPRGTRFYRVRTLAKDDTTIPLRGMRIEGDAWNPPAQFVKAGRLNIEGESLLYTSPMIPKVAIEEMKIPDNEAFSLIVYESTHDINVTAIGFTQEIASINAEERLKIALIDDFLTHEFSRDVGIGTEYLYKTSETIIKDYFDLPPQVQDAWGYPSVAEKRCVNVCFRPDNAKEKLQLIGVQIATCQRTGDGAWINVKYIASGFDNNGVFQYHAVGSKAQREAFPEITVTP